MVRSSREAILAWVRANLPPAEAPPPDAESPGGPPGLLVQRFESALEALGGRSWRVTSAGEAAAKIAEIHPAARIIASAAPEVPGTLRVERDVDPHGLAGVEVGVVRARFGVAETGAVWVTQEDLVVNALAFLPQHLVVLLDPAELVRDMHEAYLRARPGDTPYGCFLAGPSATGDIEGVIIHGAQGPRTLDVLLLAPGGRADDGRR